MDWWNELSGFEQMYWGVALVASLFFIVLLIMTILGADGDTEMGHVDADVEADTGIGSQFLSIKNLAGFFTLFGWSGISSIDAGNSKTVTVIISIVCGLIMMTLMALLYRSLRKMVDSGTLNLNNAIGGTGEVYMQIPSKRGGIGKIQIQVQGSLRTLDAMTDDEENAPTGSLVKVEEIINDHILLVKKY